MQTAIAKNVVEMHAPPVRAIDAAKPFFNLTQLQGMDRVDLEALALTLQTRTTERRTREGVLVSIQRLVPLVYGRSEDIFKVDPMGMMINAKGYRKIANYAGVHFFPVQTVMVDGEPKSNPCTIYDRIGQPKRCIVRMVAIWRGPNGDPVGHDLTLTYDPGTLFVVAMHGKMKDNVTDITMVSRRLGDPCEPGWAFFPEMEQPGTETDDRGPLYIGLMANLANQDVCNLMKDRSAKAQWMDRYATTFCRRNLIKQMLNVNVPQVVNGLAAVPVLAWVAPSDESLVTRAIEAARGISNPYDIVHALEHEGVIVTASAMDASADAEGAMDETADEESTGGSAPKDYELEALPRRTERAEHKTPAPEPQPEPQPAAQATLPMNTPADRSAQIAGLMKRLDAAKTKIGAGPYRAACESCEVDPEKPGAKGIRTLEALVTECEDVAKG